MSKNRKENSRKKVLRDARTAAKLKVSEARKWLSKDDMEGVRRALNDLKERVRLSNYGWNVRLSDSGKYIKTNGLYC